jgi:hypothetical protein
MTIFVLAWRPCLSNTKLFANYEALSYTWDNEMLTRNISVNDSQLRITENLFEALRHLGDKEKRRTIWVDAV